MGDEFEARLRGLEIVMPAGVGDPGGPTRSTAYGPSWRRTDRALFVPSHVPDTAEQRIVEAVLPLPGGAGVTSWASMRLRGGAYFEGRGRPVSVVVPQSTRPRPREGVRWLRRDRSTREGAVLGIPLVAPGEALLDLAGEEVAAGRAREAVVALDMRAAAGLGVSQELLDALSARTRVPSRADIQRVARLACEGSMSPPESRLRLIWMLDAGLPRPLLNTWVCDTDGRPLVVPDLLDPDSGLAVEYDGGVHADVRRRTRDAAKDDLYRELGLESMRVTALDMRQPARVERRLTEAHARARATPRPRRWRLGERFTGARVSPGERSA